MSNITVVISHDVYKRLKALSIPCAIVLTTQRVSDDRFTAKDYLTNSINSLKIASSSCDFLDDVSFDAQTNVISLVLEGSKLEYEISTASIVDELVYVLTFYQQLRGVGLSVDEIVYKKELLRRIINTLTNYKILAF